MLGIIAVGMMFIMLTGGIDLSVGSLVAVSGVLTSMLTVNMGVPTALAVVIALLVVVLLGLISGVSIVVLGISPIIATLGVMTIARGISYILSEGKPIYRIPEVIKGLGQGYIALIPVPVWIMIIVFIIGGFVLYQTPLGRYCYAIGGNLEATRLSGVNVKKVTLLVYLIGALLCGIAGLILMGRLNSGQPSSGNGLELDVITAVVLGGVSVAGGAGKLSGVIVGVAIMGILANGLLLMNVNDYYQMVVKGSVLILAVGFDSISKSGAFKKNKLAV
jgi:ribose transport system permease protein